MMDCLYVEITLISIITLLILIIILEAILIYNLIKHDKRRK